MDLVSDLVHFESIKSICCFYRLPGVLTIWKRFHLSGLSQVGSRIFSMTKFYRCQNTSTQVAKAMRGLKDTGSVEKVDLSDEPERELFESAVNSRRNSSLNVLTPAVRRKSLLEGVMLNASVLTPDLDKKVLQDDLDYIK